MGGGVGSAGILVKDVERGNSFESQTFEIKRAMGKNTDMPMKRDRVRGESPFHGECQPDRRGLLALGDGENGPRGRAENILREKASAEDLVPESRLHDSKVADKKGRSGPSGG